MPLTLLNCISIHYTNDPKPAKLAILRALRALGVAIADCAGFSIWGLGEECSAHKNEIRATLDYMFQVYLSRLTAAKRVVADVSPGVYELAN